MEMEYNFLIILFILLANINEISHGIIGSKINDNESNGDDGNGIEDETQKEYNKLKAEKNEKDDTIRRLEKDYLKKISELLIMIQVHCEVKNEMYEKFKEIGAFKENKK